MPDLTTPAVKSWLDRMDPPLSGPLPDAIRGIEQDPDVETALAALAAALGQAHARDPVGFLARLQAKSTKAKLRAVLAQLGDARAIRLLDWLSEPACPARRALLATLLANDGTGAGKALQSAVRSLSRRALTLRMLACERLTALASACKTARFHPA